jgi:hypothetical protein
VNEVTAVVVIVVGFAAVLGAVAWWGTRIRRRGRSPGTGALGAVVGPFDEIFNPGAHRARHQVEAFEERVEPGATADDRPPTPAG